MWRVNTALLNDYRPNAKWTLADHREERVSIKVVELREFEFRFYPQSFFRLADCLLCPQCIRAIGEYDHDGHEVWRRSPLDLEARVAAFVDEHEHRTLISHASCRHQDMKK